MKNGHKPHRVEWQLKQLRTINRADQPGATKMDHSAKKVAEWGLGKRVAL